MADLSHSSSSSVFGIDLSSIAAETFSSSVRYVLVHQDGTVAKPLWVSEIAALLADGSNMALQNHDASANVTVTQKPGVANNGCWPGGAQLIDGATTRDCQGWATTLPTNNMWVQIDLGQA